MENQEALFKLSMFEQQIQQLQQQMQAVKNGRAELQSLHSGIGEISGSVDKEIFARIGRGIYARAKITSEKLLVNIGESNLVDKSVSETKTMIEEQISRLDQVEKELEENLDSTNKEFLELVQEYQSKKE